MAYNKEDLDGMVQLVLQLCEREKSFEKKLREAFELNKSTFKHSSNEESDLSFIRSVLELRGKPSIDYDFIDHEYTKQQLKIDNVRMENVRFDSRESNHQVQFYKFCTYAVFQIENLLNYFCHVNFRDVKDVVSFIATNYQKSEKFIFDGSKSYRSVSEIALAFKSNAFCQKYTNPISYLNYFIGSINKVRNENLHRCSIAYSDDSALPNFYQAYRQYSLELITTNLNELAYAVKTQIV
jgi:hypothetical protein